MFKDDVTTFVLGDGTDEDRHAVAQVLDRRADGGGVDFALNTYFTLPGNGDPSCEPPFQPYGSLPICPLQFQQLPDPTQGWLPTLQSSDDCDDGIGTTWTGHLVEQ